MKRFIVLALSALLAACADTPPPAAISPSPDPDDPAGPSANLPYRPVMAGTATHGVGSQP
jgi:hypothetical protein